MMTRIVGLLLITGVQLIWTEALGSRDGVAGR
jgi:hypothetical protein